MFKTLAVTVLVMFPLAMLAALTFNIAIEVAIILFVIMVMALIVDMWL